MPKSRALLEASPSSLRPIVCGEPLRRLITRTVVLHRTEEISAYLGPTQFAIGNKGGAEGLATAVKHTSQLHPELVWVKLDLENAFNKQFRSIALDNLRLASPLLHTVLRTLIYTGDSEYWYPLQDPGSFATLSASDGIEQGDPAGPVLFACGIKNVLHNLKWALSVLAGGDPVFVFNYLDDTIVGVPPHIASSVVAQAEFFLGSAGHTVNESKTKVWAPSGVPPPGFAHSPLWQPGGIKVTGVPIGSTDFVVSVATDVVTRTERIATKVRALAAGTSSGRPAVQCAFQLLRLCIVPRFDFIARTCRGADIWSMAGLFDSIIIDTLSSLIDLDSSLRLSADAVYQNAVLQSALPLVRGGVGLRSIQANLDHMCGQKCMEEDE